MDLKRCLILGCLLAAAAFGALQVAGRAAALLTNAKAVAANSFQLDTLSAPADLAATGACSVSLSWTATVDTYASGHRIFRGSASGGPYSQIVQVTPRTTTAYTDQPAAGTYYYVTRSFYQNWESVNSNEASDTVSAASAPVSFRAAASAGAPSDTLTLTISKPAGAVLCDVMIASIAVRPDTATITPPAGWTLVRRVDNASATANSLAVYYKVAGASEPASYSWSFSTSTGSAGGILAFSGVDTTNPINVENGQTTDNGLSHATPSVTTTAANAMLVSSHTFASAATWTPPAGMSEAVDQASIAVPNAAGISLEMNYVLQAAAAATGAKTATASNDANVGNAHILALNPKP